MIDISNKDAERSVIGALVFDARVQDQSLRLTAEDFTVKEYRKAFIEIQRLVAEKKPVDLVTVGERLGSENDVISAVIEAGNMTPITFNAASYVDLVLDATMRRKASVIGEQLYRDMGNRELDTREAVAMARAKLAEIGADGLSEWMTSAEVAKHTFEDLEKRHRGDIRPVLSGIADIDYLTGGFFPGELTIVGAKPAVGKSVFAMMTALNAARSGHKSGVCSLEMTDVQYGQRLISNISGVNGMRLRKAQNIQPEDWTLIVQAVTELSGLSTGFMFTTRYIEDLTLAVRRKIDQDGLDILIVDYLQLMRTRQRTENERLTIAAISWALKCLATDCNIPVVALAQLRRPGQGETNKMPSMRDLRESGNLEADADNIILLHEPETSADPYVYSDDKPYFDQMRKDGSRYIVMKVEKQRQGSTGVVSVLFKPNQMRYLPIERRGK